MKSVVYVIAATALAGAVAAIMMSAFLGSFLRTVAAGGIATVPSFFPFIVATAVLYLAIPRSAAPALDRVLAELGLVGARELVRVHVPDILLEDVA